MASSNEKNLGPGPDAGRTGSDVQSQAAGSGHVIRTYCETVLKQPSDGLPKAVTTAAPNFLVHLKTAQGNASHFIDDIQPVMMVNVSDLLSFSNMWGSFSPLMIQYAQEGKYDVVAQGLKVMQTRIKTYSTNAQNTHNTLTQFQKTVTGDARAFTADYQLLTSSESGIPAQIGALDKEIDAENDAVTKFAAMIAGGAAAAILGGVMIVAGAVTDVITAGTSTPLIVAGVLVAGGGVALITVGSIGVDKASKVIRNATSQKAQLSQELTSLKAYDTTVKNLKTGVDSAVTAIGNLATSWEYLHEDMNAVISDLETAKSTVQLPWFKATLDTADADWGQVGKMAKAVQLQVANATFKQIDMSKPGSSLIDALPADAQATIRSEEQRKLAA